MASPSSDNLPSAHPPRSPFPRGVGGLDLDTDRANSSVTLGAGDGELGAPSNGGPATPVAAIQQSPPPDKLLQNFKPQVVGPLPSLEQGWEEVGGRRRQRKEKPPASPPGRSPDSPSLLSGGPLVSASVAWSQTNSSPTAEAPSGAWVAGTPAIASGTARHAILLVKILTSAPARLQQLPVTPRTRQLPERLALAVRRLQPLLLSLVARGSPLLLTLMHPFRRSRG